MRIYGNSGGGQLKGAVVVTTGFHKSAAPDKIILLFEVILTTIKNLPTAQRTIGSFECHAEILVKEDSDERY